MPMLALGSVEECPAKGDIVELDPTFSAGGGGPSGTDYRGVSSILHGHNHSEYQSRVMIALSLLLLTPTVPRSGSFFVHFRNQPHTRVAATPSGILNPNEQVQCEIPTPTPKSEHTRRVTYRKLQSALTSPTFRFYHSE